MKILKKLLTLFIFIAPIVLIAVDLLLTTISLWIVIGILIIQCIWVIKKVILKGKKTRNRVLLSCVEVCIIVLTLFGIFCNPYFNSISFHKDNYNSQSIERTYTYRQAKQDITYVYRYLIKDHPAFIKKTTKEDTRKEMKEKYESILKDLEHTDRITTTTVWKAIQRLLASMKDAHTTSYWVSKDIHYLKYIRDHREKGDQLVKINGLSLEKLFESKKEYFSYELESWAMSQLGSYLCYAEGLIFLDIDVSNGVTYTYDNNGVETDYIYHLTDFVTNEEYEQYYATKNKDSSESETDSEQSFVYYNLDKDASLGVLTIDSCNYNQEYRNTVKNFFTDVKANNIQHIAVDLRENGGGNSLVADEFIKYLNVDKYYGGASNWRLGFLDISFDNNTNVNDKKSELLFYGDVYVLTSVDTFSSAMMFTEMIQDNQLGKIVGEIPGENPNGYGDVSVFKTPNAKIYLQISTKEFTRADENNKDNCITPDYICNEEDALTKVYELLKDK
jgi:C-terminal processing protease CtpA/Prc